MPAAVVLDRAPRSESAGHLRRLPRLLVPAGTYCGLADWPASLALIALFSCTGGMYACMSSSFAALADVTTGMDPTVRARKFGMAEGGIWLGLVAGPVAAHGNRRLVLGPHAIFLCRNRRLCSATGGFVPAQAQAHAWAPRL